MYMKNKLRIDGSDKIKKLSRVTYMELGADPEFFILSKKNENIIESNKVLPENGISLGSGDSKVTIDGVQAELNPYPSLCRQGAAKQYVELFRKLAGVLSKKNAFLHATSMVHLTKEELDELSEESKRFGCESSLNSYTGTESEIKVDPSKYGYRSAGGHIHIGMRLKIRFHDYVKKHPKFLVSLLDLILGNTCVMIDRDDNQIERRKVYGRAGEYRLPVHGLEYRTLSNFWIRNYQLMSMVYGFTRFATNIAYNIYMDESPGNMKGYSEYREILSLVNEDDIQKAINTNNFDMAKNNWDVIKDTLMDMIPHPYARFYPVTRNELNAFEYFIDKGLCYWFGSDNNIIGNWTTGLPTLYYVGWESFLTDVVAVDMQQMVTWRIGHNGFIVMKK